MVCSQILLSPQSFLFLFFKLETDKDSLSLETDGLRVKEIRCLINCFEIHSFTKTYFYAIYLHKLQNTRQHLTLKFQLKNESNQFRFLEFFKNHADIIDGTGCRCNFLNFSVISKKISAREWRWNGIG